MIDWNITEFGDKKLPPLVLLHGFAGTHEYWRKHLDIFADKYFLIFPDLPGHGKSIIRTFRNITIKDVAENLIAQLQNNGISKCSIVGYSMGGRLASEMIVQNHQMFEKIVLVSANSGIEDISERESRLNSDLDLADKIEQNGMFWFADYWRTIPLFSNRCCLPETDLNCLYEIWLKQDAIQIAKSLRSLTIGKQDNHAPILAEKSKQLLLLAGEHDHKYLKISEKIAFTVDTAKLEIMKNCGHDVPFENPELFQNTILQYLAQA